MPSGRLEVNVLEANGIKDTELFGKADPYAVLSCGETKLRTSTAQDQGSHPVWNQKLAFNINEGTFQLTVRIYNENVLQDDEIGSAVIPLAKVFSNGKVASTSYNVMRPSGRTQGTVKLELSFTPKRLVMEIQLMGQSIDNCTQSDVSSDYWPDFFWV